MSPRDFDRYMVAFGAARHVKFRRLTIPERHAFFLGVLSIAGQSPMRGCLLVGSLKAEAADVAQEADVHVRVAQAAMDKLREVGVIYFDEDLGCERVHDFEDWNPAPKIDRTSAARQARYRAKLRDEGLTRSIPSRIKDAIMARDRGVCVVCGSADRIEFHHRKPISKGGDNSEANIELRCFGCHRGHAGHDVTSRVTHANGDAVSHGKVTPTEVEVEEPPLTPPDQIVAFEAWLLHYEQTTGHQLPGKATKAFHSIAASYSARRKEGYSAEDLTFATVGAHADTYRRENGYDTAESILKPTKVASLVAKGKLRTGGTNGPKSSAELAAEFNRRPVA